MVASKEVRAALDTKDVDSVRTLMREYGRHLADHPAGPEHFCLSGLESELECLPQPYTDPGVLLLAQVEGHPAGCTALKELPGLSESSGAFSLELRRLWVRPEFRGMGVGRDLMQASISHARAVGARSIFLETIPAVMPEAGRLYAKFGFEEIEAYNNIRVPGIAFFRLNLNRV